MTNKMKLLVGLLVLGIALLGGGLVFLLLSSQPTVREIMLTPSPGNYLFNSENTSSEVLLKSVQIEKSISDKQYQLSWASMLTVNVGEPVFEVNVLIQNDHTQNKEIALYAEGYDKSGEQVT